MPDGNSPEAKAARAGGKSTSYTADTPCRKLRDFLSAATWAKRDLAPPERLLGDLVTKTTRMFLVGRTGLGKTMLGFGLAFGMASGAGFLHWRSARPARVLYIDGEMPAELIKARVQDAARRALKPVPDGNLIIFAQDLEEEFAAAFPVLGKMAALDEDAGHTFIMALIEALGGVDVVIFDNVMSLVSGDHKEEVPWSKVLPLVSKLTRKQVGQVWLDHTGHNAERQYGTSTKAWRFDSVGVMGQLPTDQAENDDLGFTLSFEHPGKARRRTPSNWQDFAACTIRLTGDKWMVDTVQQDRRSGGGGTSGLTGHTKRAYEVLSNTIIACGQSGHMGVPDRLLSVQDQLWREEFYKAAMPGAEAQARRRAFQRAGDKLVEMHMIGIANNRVWIASRDQPEQQDQAGEESGT